MDSLPIIFTTRLRHFVVCAAMCALFAGCRKDPYLDSHIEILNAEKRALENQLYELEYDYEQKIAEVERLKERLSEDKPAESTRRSTDDAPVIELPDTDFDSMDFSPPSVTPGVPESSSSELPSPNSGSQLRRRPNQTQSVGIGRSLLQPADPRITHIYIDPQHTGGSDFDQRSGDDGLFVVIEPRNRSNHFVPLAGPVTVVALDYSRREAGDEPRIAKWELTAKQVDHALHNNESQKGIYLRLPWTEEAPSSSKLMVAVRYVTADGRKLEATRDVFVTLPGQVSQRWTPRSSDDSDDRIQANGVNVARQPSATDGAQTKPQARRSEATVGVVAPVAHETEVIQTAVAPTQPTWSPTR